MKKAGLTSEDQDLPAPVKTKSGLNGAGESIRYYLNYSSQPQTFTYAHESGVDLLTQKPIEKSKAVRLAPWDLVIVEER